jgi:zinc protease
LGTLLLPLFARAADPAAAGLVQGVLPNGFRYFILPHASPKNDVSLRLIVRAGSLDERDDERGFAHFVEHTAFNGSRNHPPGTVLALFQRLGLNFGADLNANTGYTHTTYLLDLPVSRPAELDEALSLLRDDADGQTFPRNEVTQESGVIISELNASDSAGRRVSNQLLENLFAGTAVPNRTPLGVLEQISHATPEQLAGFYQRNYLPGRMMLLVVGPVDAPTMVEKISAVFGSIAATTNNPPAPSVSPPAVVGIKPHVIVVPTNKGATVDFAWIGARPPDTVEGRRAELIQRIATSLLETRLALRREREDVTHYGPPRAGYDVLPLGDSLVSHALTIGTNPNAWYDGVELMESEARRARGGVSQSEVDEAVKVLLSSFRRRIIDASGQSAARVADDVARALVSARTWRNPTDDLAEATRALQGLTAVEVTSVLAEIFPSEGLHLVVRVPPDFEIKPDRLVTVYQKSSGKTLKKAAAPESGELTFRYENFGPAGKVTKNERVEDLDLTLAEFANGVRVNVRPSTFEPERFRLRIVFPYNFSFVPSDRGGIADLAGQILLSSNLSKHKESELTRLTKLHGVAAQFSVTHGTPVMGFTGPANALPFTLRLLTALLSDLKMDREHDSIALSRYAAMHHSLLINPRPYALADALYIYTGKDPRVGMNPPEFFQRTSPDEAEDWLTKNVLHGPLEIGIVGDLKSEETVALAAETVGTLPRRNNGGKPGAPISSPTKPSRTEGTAEIPASTSMSCVLWPVRIPDDPRHNAALALATDVLHDRLIIVLREVFGATYSPDVRVYRDAVQRDFAFAAMVNTFDPETAVRWTEGSVRLAARLAEKGVNDEEFTRLREPLRTRYSNDLHNNNWWLNSVVCTAQSRRSNLDEARVHASVVDELTVEEVNQAAQVFKLENVTAHILRPKAPKPGTPPKPKS